MKKCVKPACHVVNSNISIGSLATLLISLGTVALFEKVNDSDQIFTVVLNIGRMHNTFVSIKCMM